MAELKNSFIAGKMNKDLDERLIKNGEYRDALNIIVNSSEGSEVGSVQNLMGNTKKADIATLSGRTVSNAKCIGTVKNEPLGLVYWFVASDFFDGIYEYNLNTGVSQRILQSNKATANDVSKLNFSQEYLITGVNFIDGFIYWTDNYNPPRKINISRVRSYFVDDSRIDDDISVILAPPLSSPKIELSSDGNENSNNMEEKFLYFSYRYKYIDDQYSAISPFSAVAFTPSSFGFDYEKGNNISMSNIYNKAKIYFNTGGVNVKEIQLLVRDTRSLNVSIIETLSKEKYGYNDFTEQFFEFENNKTYSTITSDQVTRLFDNVPVLAKAQDFVGNRLMYGNYTQFFDIKDDNGEDIKIDLSLNLVDGIPTVEDTPIQTFRSDREYEVGIEYLDDYGRTSTVLTSPKNTAYIPPSRSTVGNSLMVEVKNKPPYWATKFRFLMKQNKGEYYNIFPILFYSDALYRYFKINDSDLDKLKVGDYVILKSDASVPTLSNKEYKVLEVDTKAVGFLGGSELSGLYFKIKVDNVTEIDGGQVTRIGSSGYGAGFVRRTLTNRSPRKLFNTNNGRPVVYAETPIHYGNGNPDAVTLVNAATAGPLSSRYTIYITSLTEFKVYKKAINEDSSSLGGLVHTGTISQGATLNLAGVPFSFKFSSTSLVVGDRYIVNFRGYLLKDVYYDNTHDGYNTAVLPVNSAPNFEIKRGAVITLRVVTDKFNDYVNTTSQTFDPSPADYLNIEEWWHESGASDDFIFYSKGGTNVGERAVTFARGNVGRAGGTNSNVTNNFITQADTINNTRLLPLNMLVSSTVLVNDSNSFPSNTQPELVVNLSLTQSDKSIVFETEGKSIDSDIFHELSNTYRIESNLHKVFWSYEDYTVAAGSLTNLGQAVPGTTPTASDVPHRFSVGESIYVLSDDTNNMPTGTYTITSVPDAYNVIIDLAFPGSGPVTGGRISYTFEDQDQANYSTQPLKVRLNNVGTKNTDYNAWAFGNGLESYRILDDWNETTLDYSLRVNSFVEDYKERHSFNAICYSGIYGENTGVDRLNEFNLSLANFKYLDLDFGSIQRLHARDNDLLVLQQDKISKLLYGKNLLFDAIGGGQVASIPEVLGNQISYPYEYGISNNPESFAVWGNELFFTDERRGSVIKIQGDSLDVVSKYGMRGHFRDLMIENKNTQKLGAYDPFLNMYVLSSNTNSINPCNLRISRNEFTYNRDAYPQTALFKIITSQAWSISLASDGFGTDWVSTLTSLSGTGDKVVSASIARNNTGSPRTLRYIVTYCDKTVTFTLRQGTSSYKEIVNIVFNNNTRGLGDSSAG